MLAVFLVAVAAMVGLGSLAGAPGLRDGRGRARWALMLIYAGFGVLHVSRPLLFLPIMPPILPFPKAIIIGTGLCEIAGAVGLALPATRRWAGAALALYAVCVYPANLYHAFYHVEAPGLPSSWWYHVPRLLLQPVICWWALYVGEDLDWPFSAHRPPFSYRASAPAPRP